MDASTYQANANPKSVSKRGIRAAAVVRYNDACLPARLLLDAREEHRLAHQRAKDALSGADVPPGDALALVRAACLLRSQLLDMLGTPTRPRGESPRRRPIDAPAIPTTALEIAPVTPPDAPAPDASP